MLIASCLPAASRLRRDDPRMGRIALRERAFERGLSGLEGETMAVDPYLAQLSELLATYFNRADVKALCLELDFNYDSLPPAGVDEQIIELVLALARRGRLPALLEALRRKRPTVAWPDVPPDFRPPAGAGWAAVPVWGWAVGLVVLAALAALAVWAALVFRDGDGNEILEVTPPGTAATGAAVTAGATSVAEPSATSAGAPSPSTPPQVGDAELIPLPGGSEIERVFVPAGSFRMGSQTGDRADEQPAHRVALDAFWMGRQEVTNSQWAAFTAYTGHATTAEQEGGGYNFIEGERVLVEGANWQHPQGPGSDIEGLHDHPVVLASWADAAAYCAWVGGRLPTEAEWEYAARGEEALRYPWGNTFDGGKTNFCDRNCPSEAADGGWDDGYEFTAPVDAYAEGVSWVKALNMAGNVWEWVYDWYKEDFYRDEVEPVENPTGPTKSTRYRVLRGGGWSSRADGVRSSIRHYFPPDRPDDVTGFRCAWD
jgi:formylglycine-generating enzyme required for sulfatase activity